ncbi:MAG TPA: NADH-quinone oxidoreductase subunit K [bacterium]|nr:NADH-quinone oxidoreductase subunit K [bacterium]
MAINSFFIVRGLILLLGLVAFYHLWTASHLLKKVMAWLIFQISIVLLWISSAYVYHGHLNPLPQVAAFLILVFTTGILGIMLVFCLGISRRHDTLDIEKINHGASL